MRGGRYEPDGRPLPGLARLLPGAERNVVLAPFGWDEDRDVGCGVERAKANAHVGLRQVVGEEALRLVIGEYRFYSRVDAVVDGDDEAGRADRLIGERYDGVANRLRSDLEVRPLLLGKVVVEAVDDEQRDERQRHGDQHDQRDGQACLEGLRAEVPDAATER